MLKFINQINVVLFPIGIILYKLLKKGIRKCCRCEKKTRMNIDMEYAMIITKLESVIAFSCVLPLLVPVSLIAIQSNKFFYKKMIFGLEWELTSYKGSQSFPINFLIFGILFGQTIIILFFKFCLNPTSFAAYLWIILTVLLAVLDVSFFVLYKKTKKNKDKSSYYIVP